MANPLKVVGLVNTIGNLLEIKDEIDEVFGDTLEEMAFRIEKNSINRTPELTGNLRRSHDVERASDSEVKVVVREDYAFAVHERTEETLRGEPRPDPLPGHYWEGGESKFLEKAFNEVTSTTDPGDILWDRMLDLFF